MREVRFVKDHLEIKFYGGDFRDSLKVVKSLYGSEFINGQRVWIAPPTKDNVRILQKAWFTFKDGAEELLRKEEEVKEEVTLESIPGLYPFQQKGVEWLEMNNGNGLIGDEMGLGKTVQSLAYLSIHPELRPAVVICTATMKPMWQREIKKWTGEDALILNGTDAYELPDYPFYIINYDILFKRGTGDFSSDSGNTGKKQRFQPSEYTWTWMLEKMKIRALIGDEVQYVGNPKSKRTKCFVWIKKKAKPDAFIPLSGTPIRKRPKEFYPILNLLDPVTFSNHWKYLNKFCGAKYNGFGWSFDGASETALLHNMVRPLMIRRLKKDVLPELPPKRKIIVPMELDAAEKEAYEGANQGFMNWLKSNIKAGLEGQKQIEVLKQQAYIAKRNSVIQWIREFLDTEDKLVVFTYHVNALKDLVHEFGDIAVYVDGSVTGEKRQEAVDKFQTDDSIHLFVGQVIAAGVGITLTAASACVFVEFPWTAGDVEQASDRIHRISQQADSVTAYFLIAPGTVEDHIMNLLQGEYENVKQILDGEKGADLFDGQRDNLLSGLLDVFRGKVQEE